MTDENGSTQDSRLSFRWWLLNMAAIAFWAAILSASVTLKLPPVALVIVAVGSFLGIAFFVEPRRRWWSPQIRALTKDGTWARDRRGQTLLALLISGLVVPVAVTVILFRLGF